MLHLTITHNKRALAQSIKREGIATPLWRANMLDTLLRRRHQRDGTLKIAQTATLNCKAAIVIVVTESRFNDYYGSLAVERGCLSNFKRAVALMSPTEQRVQHIRTP